MEAYWINTATQSVIPVEYERVADLERMVGSGSFTVITRFDDGSLLFADDDGLNKAISGAFMLKGSCFPICSSAVLVGPELPDQDEGLVDQGIVKHGKISTMLALSFTSMVTFMSAEDVRRWAIAHADEPTITVGNDVLARVRDTFLDFAEL